MNLVGVLNYGLGNINSIVNMINKVGGHAIVIHNIPTFIQAKLLILPGVGSFDHGITLLKSQSYFPLLNEAVLENRVPILGICLGAQLFTNRSEEGKLPGLEWVNGVTKKT